MNQIVADKTLTDDQKRKAIGERITEKNRQLRQLLTPAQQAEVIPTTERQPAQAVQKP
jgi:hypothetical protein